MVHAAVRAQHYVKKLGAVRSRDRAPSSKRQADPGPWNKQQAPSSKPQAPHYGQIYMIKNKKVIRSKDPFINALERIFKNEEEAKFFMMGVDEANGWLEYEVASGWFDK